MMILFTSSFVPYSFASVESEALEDVLAGCRDGQTLVYRAAYLDYVCVDPSTAIRWVELGLAEIAQEFVESDVPETIETSVPLEESEFPGAPPVAPKPIERNISDDSECREGNILIYRFAYQDTICTSPSTASSWERLGISEIVKKSTTIPDDPSFEVSIDLSSENVVETTEKSDIDKIETLIEEDLETLIEEESENIEDIVTIPFDSYPMIREVEDNIYNFIDDDGSMSFLIEGDEGIIAINSLSSSQSTKKAIDEFEKVSTKKAIDESQRVSTKKAIDESQNISDKKIKVVILTNISPETIIALEAYEEKSDGVVDIVISEDLLQYFEKTFDSDVENAIPFSNSLSVDVAGLNLELFVNDENDSFQTLIYLQNYGKIIVADSEFGAYPFPFDIEPFSEFLIEGYLGSSKNDL